MLFGGSRSRMRAKTVVMCMDAKQGYGARNHQHEKSNLPTTAMRGPISRKEFLKLLVFALVAQHLFCFSDWTAHIRTCLFAFQGCSSLVRSHNKVLGWKRAEVSGGFGSALSC